MLPEAITGVKAKIIVALGNRFPMINAHKVLAAYGCLIPRLMSGAFDVTRHRAVWPSTGNYCRGGVAIAKLLGCRSIAVLPEGMSRERFNWLEDWVVDPKDIHRTPGTESNVKEIYDACHALAKDKQNLILNQFAEYGNYIIHRAVTGPALDGYLRAQQGWKQQGTRLRMRHRIGRNACRGRLSQAARSEPIRASSRPWNVPHCSITAMASTTSRALATSMCRSSTTSWAPIS